MKLGILHFAEVNLTMPSTVMYHYRTGGTPWFIFINQEGKVVFNDFHLNTEKAIEFLQTIK